ncbi:CD276 antigen homolog [Enoplosus armatus]|uniref:CD276 antigen homolog n=1 Tax=Enoplosus armatus TaxID=215367 RepID=UPI00399593D4
MRTFLGVLMVVIVSGDEETQVTGVLEDSVHLPCNCSERDLDKEFQWQMEEPKKTLVLNYNSNTSNLDDRYEGRAKIFLNETKNNCSVLLTNIAVGDQGKYRCSFHSQDQYKAFFVNLKVSASYNVCQDSANNLNGNLSVKVFQCDVNGRYRDTEIQWNLDGQLLANASTTNIMNTYTLDAPTGLYHFHSTLGTELNTNPEPTCVVKAKGISTKISYGCRPVTEPFQGGPKCIWRYVKIIPIILVIVLSLVLWRRGKFSQ